MKYATIRTGVAAGLVGIAALTGCSSDRAKSSDTAKPKKKTPPPAATPFIANTTNTPGTLEGFVGARTDVRDTACEATDKGWVARGTVENPTKNPAQYRIYVSFLDGDATVAIAEDDLASVAAGSSADWHVASLSPGKDLRCVLRVERARA